MITGMFMQYQNTIVSARKGMTNLKILHAFNTIGIVDSDLGLSYVYEKFYLHHV